MTKQSKTDQGGKQIGFRLDAGTHAALMRLAEDKGVTVSEFFRAVAERVLAPAKVEEDERAAAIKALPAGPREKALRAVEIQKRLRELRAQGPKAHALSSLFQDGSGPATDSEVGRLEAELAALGKAFDAEVGPAVPASKTKKKGSGPDVLTVQSTCDEYEAECSICGEMTPAPNVEAGQVKDFNCAKCGGELKTNEKEVWPAADGDEPPADDDDEAPDEVDEEEEKTAAEKEADRFLEITGLINSLRGCREKRSILDDFMSGPPACDLLIKELEAARGGAVLDEGRFEELRDMAAQAVKLRKKIAELEAADADASGPTIKKLAAELETMAAGLRDAAAKKKKKAEKGSGSSSWF